MNNRALDIALRQAASYAQLVERTRVRIFPPGKRHRVYMSFVQMQRSGWHCRFHEDDLPKTPISRQFIFLDKAKIYEAGRRAQITQQSVTALDLAIAGGRGGIWLDLTEDQYQKQAIEINALKGLCSTGPALGASRRNFLSK